MLIKCNHCHEFTDSDNPECLNCGLLINIPIKDQPKHGFFSRVTNTNLISSDDWATIILYLFIPGLNLYIFIRYFFLNKKQSILREFLKGAMKFIGFSILLFIILYLLGYFF